MMSFSDHSAVDIAADPISEVESFLQLFPFLFEQRASPWTPDTLADSHRLQVNAEVSFLRCNCLTPSDTDILLDSVCQYSVLLSGASEDLKCSTLKTLSLVSMMGDSLSPGVRLQAPCIGRHTLPLYAEFRNLDKHSDLT